jgi:beta-1,4-mannosyl-glycoprotein beta-1,4-N-acetylglucosaminyltransferase
MKVFDCITYFDEPLLYDIRLNILSKHVDNFVVSEAKFTHSGEEKKIKFNKNLYPKFKDRITHLIVENEPNDLRSKNNGNKRLNSIKRIAHQRDAIKKQFNKNNSEDWIIYSDSDEIPNLENINFRNKKSKVIFFKQNLFYYKFNLTLPSVPWFGSRAIKFKNLNTISDLRNLKPKKYNWWRLDTIFKKNKIKSVEIIDKGGWHFSDLRSAEEIFRKKQNDEHHDEFDFNRIDQKQINDMVQNRYINYDHSIDKANILQKWNNKIYLEKIDSDILPRHIIDNQIKYKEWFE